MSKAIANRIIELRTAIGMSAAEFAAKTPNLTNSNLQKIESGARTASDKVIKGICEFWEVPEEWLSTGKGVMKFNIKKKDPEITALYQDALYKEQREVIEDLRDDKEELKKDKDSWKQKCDQLLEMLGQAMGGKLGKLKSLVPAGFFTEKKESRTGARM